MWVDSTNVELVVIQEVQILKINVVASLPLFFDLVLLRRSLVNFLNDGLRHLVHSVLANNLDDEAFEVVDLGPPHGDIAKQLYVHGIRRLGFGIFVAAVVLKVVEPTLIGDSAADPLSECTREHILEFLEPSLAAVLSPGTDSCVPKLSDVDIPDAGVNLGHEGLFSKEVVDVQFPIVEAFLPSNDIGQLAPCDCLSSNILSVSEPDGNGVIAIYLSEGLLHLSDAPFISLRLQALLRHVHLRKMFFVDQLLP